VENSNTNTLPALPQNNDQLKALRQVSLLFFMVIGIAHLLTGLFINQNLLMPISNIINKALDIPFALIAVIFGLSQTKIDPTSPRRKIYYIFMMVISLLVLGILLYINLLVPDRIS